MKKLLRVFQPHINVKMGTLGALLMGSVAYSLNAEFSFWQAVIPAIKQFVYTFFVGGILVRMVERLSVSNHSKFISYLKAVCIPTAITSACIAALHLFRGTPNPAITIFYTAMAAPPGFVFVAIMTRKKHNENDE